MHGLTTIEKINRDNNEAYDIMESKGYPRPVFETAKDAPKPTTEHFPLGVAPVSNA